MKHVLILLACTLLSPSVHGKRLRAGAIPFDPPGAYATGAVPEPIAVADFDGDGWLDIATANTAADGRPGGDNVTLLWGGPGGTFTRGGEISVGRRPEGILAADLNRDGAPDIVTANFGEDTISILAGKGNGAFFKEVKVDVPGGPRGVVSADFNLDGFADLATSNYDADTISILLGDGSGDFSVTSSTAVGRGPEVLAVAHLDRDGVADILTCNVLDDSLTALRGAGNGNFSVAGTHQVGELPRALVVADLNKDDLDDAIVANHLSHTVTVEENLGGFSFQTATTLSLTIGDTPLRRPVGLDLADVNADGKPDLLTTWASSDVFTVFPGAKKPFEFKQPSAVQTGELPVGIAASDVDLDGTPDVIVSAAGADHVEVYRDAVQETGIVIDNGDAGTVPSGSWEVSSAPFPHGANSLFSRGDNSYLWQAGVPEAGQYEVFLWWTVSSSRSPEVPVEIHHAGGVSSVTVDQTRGFGTWHALGTYEFLDTAEVVVASQADSTSTCADAVLLRRASGWPPGFARLSLQQSPPDLEIDAYRVLAFHGRLEVENPREAENWTGLVVRPAGRGRESTELAAVSLFLDSNGNGKYDKSDRQLGGSLSFESETTPITFDGFREELRDGSATDFFIVCTREPETIAAGEAASSSGSGTISLAGLTVLALVFLSRRRFGNQIKPVLILFVLAPLVLLPAAGCGGGGGDRTTSAGGGGGTIPPSDPLAVEVSSVFLEGSVSHIPAVIDGTPLTGWEF